MDDQDHPDVMADLDEQDQPDHKENQAKRDQKDLLEDKDHQEETGSAVLDHQDEKGLQGHLDHVESLVKTAKEALMASLVTRDHLAEKAHLAGKELMADLELRAKKACQDRMRTIAHVRLEVLSIW